MNIVKERLLEEFIMNCKKSNSLLVKLGMRTEDWLKFQNPAQIVDDAAKFDLERLKVMVQSSKIALETLELEYSFRREAVNGDD